MTDAGGDHGNVGRMVNADGNRKFKSAHPDHVIGSPCLCAIYSSLIRRDQVSQMPDIDGLIWPLGVSPKIKNRALAASGVHIGAVKNGGYYSPCSAMSVPVPAISHCIMALDAKQFNIAIIGFISFRV